MIHRTRNQERAGFAPTPAEVETLIRRADRHALGRAFLRHGALDAVAVTFGVHAFVVDAARAHLARVGATAAG